MSSLEPDRLLLLGLSGELSPLEAEEEVALLAGWYLLADGRDTGLQAVPSGASVGFWSLEAGLKELRPLTEVKAGAKVSTFFSCSP